MEAATNSKETNLGQERQPGRGEQQKWFLTLPRLADDEHCKNKQNCEFSKI